MLGIKVAAIALTSLGSVTMGSDVYFAAHARSALHASWQPSSVAVSGRSMSVRAEPAPVPESRTSDPAPLGSVLTLAPWVIHSSPGSVGDTSDVDVSPPAEPLKTFGTCSDWGLSPSGSPKEGIWTLCIPTSPPGQ